MNKAILVTAAILAATAAASAQSVTPMRGVVKSFADQFAVRLTVGNPYEKAMRFDVRVYDENFQPVEAQVSPSNLRIAARDTRQATVRINFGVAPQRKVRVCAEGLFGTENSNRVRTQVCGRFLALRLGY